MKPRASWQGVARHLALSRRGAGVLLSMVLGAVGIEAVLYARGLLDHVGVAVLCGVSLLVFVGYYLGLLALQAFRPPRRPAVSLSLGGTRMPGRLLAYWPMKAPSPPRPGGGPTSCFPDDGVCAWPDVQSRWRQDFERVLSPPVLPAPEAEAARGFFELHAGELQQAMRAQTPPRAQLWQKFRPDRHLVHRPCSHVGARGQGSVVYAVGPSRRGVVLILYKGHRSCGVELSPGWARMLAEQLTRSRRVSSR